MNTEQLRAEFEAWARNKNYDLDAVMLLSKPPKFSRYANPATQDAWEAYQAGRAALQSQDRDDAAHAEWMVDDARAPWAVNSLKTLIKEMRATEKQCRNAFRKDYMRVVSEYFADSLGEAAEALEKRLSTIDHARRIEGGGE